MNEEQKKTGTLINIKNILRLLTLFCIIIVFCPTFLVSCSGEDMKVSVMTVVGGVSAYGEQVVEPHPLMLICLALPITMLVLLFVKKLTDKVTATSLIICSFVDTVIWFIFRSAVEKAAEENYCSFQTTAWFVFNVISLLLIIGLSALVLIKKVDMQASLTEKMTNTVSGNMKVQPNREDNVIGYCTKCGSKIGYGSKFCTECGKPVPEDMIAENEQQS